MTTFRDLEREWENREPPAPISEYDEERSCAAKVDIQVIDEGMKAALDGLAAATNDSALAYWVGRVQQARKEAGWLYDAECSFEGYVTVSVWKGRRTTWTCPVCCTEYDETP